VRQDNTWRYTAMFATNNFSANMHLIKLEYTVELYFQSPSTDAWARAHDLLITYLRH